MCRSKNAASCNEVITGSVYSHTHMYVCVFWAARLADAAVEAKIDEFIKVAYKSSLPTAVYKRFLGMWRCGTPHEAQQMI